MLKVMMSFAHLFPWLICFQRMYVRMLFDLSKCNCVSLHRGKLVVSQDICLPSGEAIKQLSPDGVYRYLGILESDAIKTGMMKEKLIID